MRILQILGVIVVSVMFLATPSMADHHKKGGNKAKAGQKGAAKGSPGARASQKAARQTERVNCKEPTASGSSRTVKDSNNQGGSEPMGMP